jgi:hypothetical protein
MWTNENRARYDRSKVRYPSDLTDAEWAIIAPLIPPAKRGGNKRTVVEREIVNGLTHPSAIRATNSLYFPSRPGIMRHEARRPQF